MKKMLALLLAACLFLTACSGTPADDLSSGSSVPQDDPPAQRTLEFCAKVSAFDRDGVDELMVREARGEVNFEWDDPSKAQLLEALTAFTSQNTVTVRESKVNGDHAFVIVSVEYIDFGGKEVDWSRMVADEFIAQARRSGGLDNLTEEEMIQLMCDAIVAQATDWEWSKVTADYMVSLKKDGDDWFVVDAERGLWYALVCNFGKR